MIGRWLRSAWVELAAWWADLNIVDHRPHAAHCDRCDTAWPCDEWRRATAHRHQLAQRQHSPRPSDCRRCDVPWPCPEWKRRAAERRPIAGHDPEKGGRARY